MIDLVKKISPNVKILRAHFSALTYKEIINAVENLNNPDKNLSDAVEIRQMIDLIIGASFTRLQTLALKNIFYPNIDFNTPQYVLR